MVPNTITTLNEVPITMNGKIDRKALANRGDYPEYPPLRVVPRCRLTLSIGTTLASVGLGSEVPTETVCEAAAVVEAVDDSDWALGMQRNVPLDA
jgi:hypothetical protein